MIKTYSDQDIKSYFERAMQLQQNNQLNEAESIYRKILEINSSHLGAQTMLGMVCINSNRYQEGIKFIEWSLLKDPKQFWAHNALGVGFLNTHKYEKACASFNRAISIEPNFIEAYFNLGKAKRALKQYKNAILAYSKCISLNNNYAEAFNNRGMIYLEDLKELKNALNDFKICIKILPGTWSGFYNIANCYVELGEYKEAIKNYDLALKLNPDNTDIYLKRGRAFKELKQYINALEDYDRAIGLNEKDENAFIERSLVYYDLKRYKDLIEDCNRALKLNPKNENAFINRGIGYHELQEDNKALKDYDHAIQLNSKDAKAFINRGAALYSLNLFEEALKDCNRAITINSKDAKAFVNRGVVYNALKRYKEALVDYCQALELEVDNALAFWNKSRLQLLLGEYQEGWKIFEWRWKTGDINLQPRNFNQPLWLGQESIAHKIILIHHEQGFGDVIQFSRYIALIEKYHPKEIIFEAPKSLISVLSSLRGNFKIIKLGDPLPYFDYYCPIMSLPLAFKTTLENIPSEMPYLYAEKSKISFWGERLGPKIKPRVGLVWSGSKGHKNDHNRSLLFKQLKPIYDLPFEFHCLQKEIREIDLEVLGKEGNIKEHQNELIDFSDTAALINHLDLVVSVDTSVAHLAGALGKKVFLMLPYAPDYRWMDERPDTPWYPTMVLFRQPKADDWTSVVSEIRLEIKNILSD
ncbi:tetratricopeptide repeat protein [Candidatus Methylopumilus planktonicus]|uniref:tetratricopeptide repeat protein n=1 Tax=Candidatus Methylopumilus planktonicus TaxID=1581557 RepID=UPI003BEEDFDC